MGLFKRKLQVVPPAERSLFIWYESGGAVARLFFTGDKGFEPYMHDQAHRLASYRLKDELRAIVAPETGHMGNAVRLYRHYIAMDLWHAAEPWPDLEPQVLVVIQRYLGWEDMPIPVSISSWEEYVAIAARYERRWMLGQF